MEAWDPTPDRAGDQRVQKRAGLEDFVQKKPRKHSSKGLLTVQPTSAIRGGGVEKELLGLDLVPCVHQMKLKRDTNKIKFKLRSLGVKLVHIHFLWHPQHNAHYTLVMLPIG